MLGPRGQDFGKQIFLRNGSLGRLKDYFQGKTGDRANKLVSEMAHTPDFFAQYLYRSASIICIYFKSMKVIVSLGIKLQPRTYMCAIRQGNFVFHIILG